MNDATDRLPGLLLLGEQVFAELVRAGREGEWKPGLAELAIAVADLLREAADSAERARYTRPTDRG